ncbi:hypothetical protein J6590_016621 [Homalodisca vitripennis]|nr:hypothetical protein J6590_016621 [Homalodisca vitripennis]
MFAAVVCGKQVTRRYPKETTTTLLLVELAYIVITPQTVYTTAHWQFSATGH